MLVILGSVLLFAAAIFGLIILINAFKESAGQGLLCMFVPFYMFYFAFARYSGSKKGMVVGSWLGTLTVGVALTIVGTAIMAKDAQAAIEDGLRVGSPPADLGAAAAGGDGAEGGGEIVNCNLSDTPGGICQQYTLGSLYNRENAGQHCEMSQIGDDKVGLADGECPTENAIAKCVPRFGSDKVTFYYPNPDADNEQAMNSMENLCTGEFTRF